MRYGKSDKGVGPSSEGAISRLHRRRGRHWFNRFDLVLEEVPVNITSRARRAMAVTGFIPAPALRMHEGDTVTISVTNPLREVTGIHWHGVRLPADMDGVPGLSFRGIAPGETFTYRFPA